MRFGVVILPELRWPVAQQQWRRAEELGFDHAWTYDHLAWRALRDAPSCELYRNAASGQAQAEINERD